jgi:hypothetical protein
MKSLTASDRKALIRLAASLPVGDGTRRAILAGLVQGDPVFGFADSYEVKGGGYTFAVTPITEADDEWETARAGAVRFTVSQGGSERVHAVMNKANFATFAGEMMKALAHGKRGY